ncbi:hypothetical protein PIB30_110310 [Stylosanthes scabra]|uniref:Uncharacterized protein n=1 Tax=Stylosanthes scabra TaxID=79078 RepID=A0ABU6R0S3_9FABA|nr:hypothetical protein [Stylosanthes scabra]
MAGRESSRSSSRGRGRGRGRAVPEAVPSASPSASTPGTSQVVPSNQAPLDPSPQPTPADSGAAVAPAGGVDADSSHGSQQVPSAAPPTKTAITWDEQKGFAPDNNACTQGISHVIELLYDQSWINYTEVPAEVKARWFAK